MSARQSSAILLGEAQSPSSIHNMLGYMPNATHAAVHLLLLLVG
jgi:hypothetical protein